MEDIQENFENQYQRTKAVFHNIGGYIKESWRKFKAYFFRDTFQIELSFSTPYISDVLSTS